MLEVITSINAPDLLGKVNFWSPEGQMCFHASPQGGKEDLVSAHILHYIYCINSKTSVEAFSLDLTFDKGSQMPVNDIWILTTIDTSESSGSSVKYQR